MQNVLAHGLVVRHVDQRHPASLTDLRQPSRRGLWLPAVEQLDDLLANPGEVGAEPAQHLGGDAFALADQAEQQMLSADVLVAKLQCFRQGQLQGPFRPRGERNMPGRCARSVNRSNISRRPALPVMTGQQ
jgi:hypothetical protein